MAWFGGDNSNHSTPKVCDCCGQRSVSEVVDGDYLCSPCARQVKGD